MHRLGGNGVNKQQRNKITPLSGNRPFSAEKEKKMEDKMTKQVEDMIKQIAKLTEENQRLKKVIKNLEEAHYNDIDKMVGKRMLIMKEIKEYIYDKIVEDFGDEADSVVYYTLDIDEFFDKLDELAQE